MFLLLRTDRGLLQARHDQPRGVNTAISTVPELIFLSISALLLRDSRPLPAAGAQAATVAAARRRRQMSTPATAPPMPATTATATMAHTHPGVPPLLLWLLPLLLLLGAGAEPGLLAVDPLHVTLTPAASTSTSPTAQLKGEEERTAVVARAVGKPFNCKVAALAACHGFSLMQPRCVMPTGRDARAAHAGELTSSTHRACHPHCPAPQQRQAAGPLRGRCTARWRAESGPCCQA